VVGHRDGESTVWYCAVLDRVMYVLEGAMNTIPQDAYFVHIDHYSDVR
jgi:hypothetical protein